MPGMERTLCARSRPNILHTGANASERHQDGSLHGDPYWQSSLFFRSFCPGVVSSDASTS
jgi:hypothetical protein